MSDVASAELPVAVGNNGAVPASIPRLFTKPEVASLLRITPRCFNDYMRNGTGPTITRVGGRVCVREDHLRAWLDDRADPPLGAADVPVGGPGEARAAYVLTYALIGLLRGTVFTPELISEMFDNLLLNLERADLNDPVRNAAHRLICRTAKAGGVDQVDD